MRAGPVWHLGYTLLTRYEGGLVPTIGMRTQLASDAIGALTFVGPRFFSTRSQRGGGFFLPSSGSANGPSSRSPLGIPCGRIAEAVLILSPRDGAAS